jgi:hypothetical protein
VVIENADYSEVADSDSKAVSVNLDEFVKSLGRAKQKVRYPRSGVFVTEALAGIFFLLKEDWIGR